MFSDREMVLDALASVKHDIVDLTKAAEETSNESLRQSLLQFRNQAEQTQVQLAQLAASKGWYIPSPPAGDNEIQQTKQQFQNVLSEANRDPVHVRV